MLEQWDWRQRQRQEAEEEAEAEEEEEAEGSAELQPRVAFGYNIRMRMDPLAPPDAACELTTRHWRIRDRSVRDLPDDEPSEHVDGPGVIGLYPLLKPGVYSSTAIVSALYSLLVCSAFIKDTFRVDATC